MSKLVKKSKIRRVSDIKIFGIKNKLFKRIKSIFGTMIRNLALRNIGIN